MPTLCDPVDVAHQAPLSEGFSRQDTGVGCHALLQGIFPTQDSNPNLMSPALAGGFFTASATWEALWAVYQLVSRISILNKNT